jgi:hypothetical protein
VRHAEARVSKEDNLFNLVERAAALHRIPPLEMWQQVAKALAEGKLAALNLLEEPAPITHPKMTYRSWLRGYRESIDRGNDPRSPILKNIILRTSDFKRWFARWRSGASEQRGPPPGSVGYSDADRKQFSAISRLIKNGVAESAYGAALKLAHEGKLPGRGTNRSRAKRVSQLYRKEHPGR